MGESQDPAESSRPAFAGSAEPAADVRRVLVAEGRLRELLSAYRAVTEGLDLDYVLHRIVDAAVSLVHADYGALGVVGPDGLLERFIHTGMDPVTVEAIGHLPEGHGLLGAVIDERRTIRLAHLGDDPRSVGFPAHHPSMSAFLGVPVRTRDQVFGNLYLANAGDHAFTEEDAELIESLAATAGIAIDNARLFDSARRHERMATTLSQVSAAFLAPAGGDALEIVAKHVGSVVDADLVTIVVPDGDRRMHVAAADGTGADDVHGMSFASGGTLPARAMSVEGVVAEAEMRGDAPASIPSGPAAAVPLIAAGRRVGALCVARMPRSAAFTPQELDTVGEFAAQASIALTLAWARRDRQRLDVAEDRARIARDLHDHVIQRLFGAGLSLQALAAGDPAHAALIEEQVAELDAAITEIRTAIFTLRTRPDSRLVGVRHRVLDVVTELTPGLDTAPRLAFRGPVDLTVRGDLADDVIAAVRESLSNVVRHANAVNVAVSVTVGGDEVEVVVDDDGRGVAPDAHRGGGTANLAERASRRHGGFVLEPRDGGGSRARWWVSLEEPVAEATL